MSAKEDLKKFYNESFRQENDPLFESLDATQIKILKNSLDFALWNLRKSVKVLSINIRESLFKKDKK